jgi:hypothetical protein
MKIRKRKDDVAFELDIKRFYAPFTISDECPKCSAKAERNLEKDYLSYPVVGNPEEVSFCCDACSHEWSRSVVLGLTLKEAK